MKKIVSLVFATSLGFLVTGACLAAPFLSALQRPVLTEQEKSIAGRLSGLRQLADSDRVGATRQLALEIRRLPATANKVRLATALSSLSTEGDFGHDTLQEVATTLADALREQPQP